jgi:UDP-N-acetylmuramoyl-tripeptide--D-alanyl-D-alanine ligase
MNTTTTMATLGELHALLPGSTLVGDGSVAITRVHSDTRTLQPGDLFVALRGERFDANDFLVQARAAGAAAAIAERGLAEAGLPGLQVADSGAALLALAAAWRRRHRLPLIAVTGSNGKTTVTQMIATILRAWLGDDALATQGNLNNHIGVPLTVLRLRAHHRAAVIELGMNHPGEIALLAQTAQPTVALVNNAQREHQEFMASVEAVARENGTVLQALGPHGTAIFPADDPHAPVWHTQATGRPMLSFALQGTADVTAEADWAADHWVVAMQTPAGAATVALRVAGLHNVRNALASTACALAAGCPLEAIVRGLEGFAPVKGRSQLGSFMRDGRRVTLVDDTYNANPDSVRAAIDVLAALPGPRWLVLGDMGEVGDQGPAFHQEVGAYAQLRGIESLWCAGALSTHAAQAFAGARHFATVAELVAAVQNHEAPACNAVVVKGSRFMRMEQVVAALTAGGAHAA